MWLNILAHVLTIVPGLASTVVAAVQAVEGPGHGPEKKTAVLDVVGEAYDAATLLAQGQGAEPPELQKETVLDLASNLTEVAVQLLHTRQRAARVQP